MDSIAELVAQMRKNPSGIRYAELCKVCDHFFGSARQNRTSHRVYKTPWQGDPRVNIQDSKGQAKTYQVKQILKAIDKLEAEHDTSK